MTKKIFIIAGEDSGDILASGMMQELNKLIGKKSTPHFERGQNSSAVLGESKELHKQSLHPIISETSSEILGLLPEGGVENSIQYIGIGGSLMKKQGLKKSLFPMKELSVMGLDILPSIPHLLKRINQTAEEILKINPDVVITIDAPEFSFRVLKKVRRKNKDIKLVHYVSPSVWAWRKGRAKKISKFLDAVLLLWPFESEYYPKIKTFYVGHSATTKFKSVKEMKKNTILCLPGSRKKEVEVLFPIFMDVINNLAEKDDSIFMKLLVAPQVREYLDRESGGVQNGVELLYTEEEKNKANGKVALCASGTAVFELALKEIPTVSAYKVGKVTECIGRLLIKLKWVTLPNIIMNKRIVPELLQKDCTAKNIQRELEKLLYSKKELTKQRSAFKAMKKKLKAGEINPDSAAANAILKIMK